jgi:hypothetical protein
MSENSASVLYNSGGVEAGTAGNPVRVDPTGGTAQPVSGSVTANIGTVGTLATAAKQDTGNTSVGNIDTKTPALGQAAMAASSPVVIANNQTAVPVSGTVTANIGTVGTLVLDATLTGGTAKAIVRGGAKGTTTSADVTSTGEGTDHQALDVQVMHSGAAIDPTAIRALTSSDVVTVSQSTASSLNATVVGAGTAGSPTGGVVSIQGVSGGQTLPVTAAQSTAANLNATVVQATASNLNATVSQATPANLNATVVQGTAANLKTQTTGGGTAGSPDAGVVTIQGITSGTAVSVSGSVTANIGTVGTLALDATLTGGTSKSIVRGGAKGSTSAADVTSTAEGADHQALDVQIMHGGVAKDPTAIRALTSSDVVTVSQSTPSNLNAAIVGTGTAGSPVSGVVTIQGISGGTAVPISGTVTASNASIGANNSTAPTSSTQVGGSDGTNLQAGRVFDLDTGAGTEYALGVSLRLPASGGSVVGGTETDPIRVDPTGTTIQPTDLVHISGSVPDATNPIPARLSDGVAYLDSVTISGVHTLAVAAKQAVVTSAVNSSTSNLLFGGSFVGTSDSSYNVSGIQINLISDQPIDVLVQQSSDGTNWDISDEFIVYPGLGGGRTFQATSQFFRVRATNIGPAATTYFRLLSVLCPSVEALPRSLTPAGMLRLSKMMTSAAPDNLNFTDDHKAPELSLDYRGQLMTRGPILTDEASYREDFTIGALYVEITGTVSFQNGRKYVSGAGTLFTSELKLAQFIKLSTDGDEFYTEIEDILSDTMILLSDDYGGTSDTGTCYVSNWLYEIGTGGSVTESSSKRNLVSGTTPGSIIQITRASEYPPYSLLIWCSMSQRIANQEGVVGFSYADLTAIESQAVIVFDGTDNTKVKLRTSFAANDVEETTVTLPNGLTTATIHKYQLTVTNDKVDLIFNEVSLASHSAHIPGPYDNLYLMGRIENLATPASSTTLAIDVIAVKNFNVVDTVEATHETMEIYNTKAASTSLSNVAAAVADTLLVAENTNRKGLSITNSSTSVLYVKIGSSGASPTSHSIRMVANAYVEIPFNATVAIYGYWVAANGAARVTEYL